MKDGISFQEAYLLPIPLVTADVDFDEDEYRSASEDHLAVATNHSVIFVPVAEPVDNSRQYSRYL